MWNVIPFIEKRRPPVASVSCEACEFKLRVSYHVLSAPGPLGEQVLMFLPLSYFEALALSSPYSAAGRRVVLNTAFWSGSCIPSCVSPVVTLQ